MWPFDRLRRSNPAFEKMPITQTRRYKGAKPSRIAGGFSLIAPTPMEENRLDLMGMVAHSRYLAQNNDYYRSFLLMCRRHIVGPTGIALQPVAKRADGTLDVLDNQAQLASWADWARRGNCTICGRFSLVDVQHMLAMMIPRDGGVFIRHFRGRDQGEHGYRFQLLTVDRLAVDYNLDLRNGGYINGGVECDVNDRIVAWHFYRRKAGAVWQSQGERLRIPAGEIDYVAVHEDYSVHLSMPWGFTAAARLNTLNGFEEAALTAARAGASKMGFFEREMGVEEVSDAPELEEFEPGMTETLPPGYKFSAFDPGYPDGESPQFVKLMLRGAAAGMGVSYNGLAGDLESTNFSSLHVGKAEERDEWRILQSWFIEHFLAVIHAEWLPLSILSGKTPLPFSKIAKFSEVAWKPRGWAAVNPVDEANANIANIGAGLSSPQRVAASKGADYDAILNELAEAKAKAEKLGLSFDPKLAPINVAPAARHTTGD